MSICVYVLRTYASHCFITAVCFSIKYQSLNDNNSEEFHASFVLQLCKPLPAAVEVVHKIYEVLNKGGKMSVHFFLFFRGGVVVGFFGPICCSFLTRSGHVFSVREFLSACNLPIAAST